MDKRLISLLKSHEFVQSALQEHHDVLEQKSRMKLVRDAKKLFSALVHHRSSDPRVTLAQIELLMSGLPELASDSKEAQALRDKCLQAIRRLAAEAIKNSKPAGGARVHAPASSIVLPPHELRLLDSQSDRISIFDREYRYTFTNTANASFHGKTPADFIGMHSEAHVGTKCFVELTKPSVDACFAGKTLRFSVSLTHAKKKLIYAATVEPVRDERGEVVAAMVITRDVTEYGITASKVWPGVDE